MHPNVNFGIKVLRDIGKKLAKSFDNETFYAGSDHPNQHLALERLLDSVSESCQEQLFESFSKEKFYTTAQIPENVPESSYWLFNPLCSPLNFSHHIPFISLSLCYIGQGEVLHAVLYNPLTDEVYCATKGAGAQFNQRRMKYKSQEKITLVFHEASSVSSPFSDLVHKRILGSTPLALMLAASNRGDFCVIDTDYCKKPEFLAARLIAKEAGLNLFKKDHSTTWVCSSSYLDRTTFDLLENF